MRLTNRKIRKTKDKLEHDRVVRRAVFSSRSHAEWEISTGQKRARSPQTTDGALYEKERPEPLCSFEIALAF
jgi:hypothetical protein